MPPRYFDRRSAGKVLAGQLGHYANSSDAIVLALPRGGVPVGSEIARLLQLPLDVFIVRKLGMPGHEELALGAIASGGVRVLNQEIIETLKPTCTAIDAVAQRELLELRRREELYRAQQPPLEFKDRTVIVVDDGLATGATMRAAVAAIRQLHAARIVVAVPVAAAETCAKLESAVDEIVCPLTPAGFNCVGDWYEHFEQATDEEVCRYLETHKAKGGI